MYVLSNAIRQNEECRNTEEESGQRKREREVHAPMTNPIYRVGFENRCVLPVHTVRALLRIHGHTDTRCAQCICLFGVATPGESNRAVPRAWPSASASASASASTLASVDDVDAASTLHRAVERAARKSLRPSASRYYHLPVPPRSSSSSLCLIFSADDDDDVSCSSSSPLRYVSSSRARTEVSS